MNRSRRHPILAAACTTALAASCAHAAEVWRSTFDSGPDGVVDIRDNNLVKQMIGPVTNGRLQITTMDAGTNAYTPDKAGRPLGATVGANSSFSGLYQFSWSQLDQTESPQTWELIGFLGDSTIPQTRQVMGTILRHWKVGADYYVGVDLAYESTGENLGGFGYNAGPATWLGTAAEGQDFQLAIGYDGPSHLLSAGLYDAAGTPLFERSMTLEEMLPGTSGEAAAIANMALTHLGWEDYSAYLTDQTTTWQNDALTYFDTADGARNSVVNLLARTWAVDADGDWLVGANWTPAGAPNGAGAAANLGSVITAPHTVTVSGTTSPIVGDIRFDNANKYTIAGDSYITLNKANATITVANGSHEIAVPLTFASGTNLTVEVINANDKLTLSSDIGAAGGSVTKTGAGTFEMLHARAGAFTVAAGSVKVLPSGGVAAGTSSVESLTIAPGARLDLTDNKLVTSTAVGNFNGTAYTGIQGEVQRAYNFGAWDQPGLTTSMPNAGPNAGILSGTETIAVATAEQVMFIGATDTAVFQGQTVTGASTIAMYTYAGDLNLDGLVDGADYGVIDNSVQFPGTDGYVNGDFNYDGVIDGADYGIIDNTIQLQGAPFPGVVFGARAAGGGGGLTAVPEPSGLAGAAVGAAALLLRLRRHRHSSAPGLGRK